MGSSKQQSTSVYNCSQSNSSGWVRALILQLINTLLDEGFSHMRLYSLCTAIANGSWILCQFTNKHLVYIYYRCPDAHIHAKTLCDMSLTWVFRLFGLRGPTPTGIQHKLFRIPIRIWNLDEESEILGEIKCWKSIIDPYVYFL